MDFFLSPPIGTQNHFLLLAPIDIQQGDQQRLVDSLEPLFEYIPNLMPLYALKREYTPARQRFHLVHRATCPFLRQLEMHTFSSGSPSIKENTIDIPIYWIGKECRNRLRNVLGTGLLVTTRTV